MVRRKMEAPSPSVMCAARLFFFGLIFSFGFFQGQVRPFQGSLLAPFALSLPFYRRPDGDGGVFVTATLNERVCVCVCVLEGGGGGIEMEGGEIGYWRRHPSTSGVSVCDYRYQLWRTVEDGGLRERERKNCFLRRKRKRKRRETKWKVGGRRIGCDIAVAASANGAQVLATASVHTHTHTPTLGHTHTHVLTRTGRIVPEAIDSLSLNWSPVRLR